MGGKKDTCWDGILTGQQLPSASPALTSAPFPRQWLICPGRAQGVGSVQVTFLDVNGLVWGVTRSSLGWSLPESTLTSGWTPPTSVFLTLGTTSVHLCLEGESQAPPMQGRAGWTFPEREPGLALAPGALVTPHPSLLQRAAKASSGQDYVYWVDHGEQQGQTWGEQRKAEGGGEGTSIGDETGCAHHSSFLPTSKGRQVEGW